MSETPKLLTMTEETYDELTFYPGWPNGYANQLFDELRAQAARVQELEADLRRLTKERDALKLRAEAAESDWQDSEAEVKRLTEALQTATAPADDAARE